MYFLAEGIGWKLSGFLNTNNGEDLAQCLRSHVKCSRVQLWYEGENPHIEWLRDPVTREWSRRDA